ncbi:MAG TPA: sulfatase-like hydrolase/transferase [Verrucomicrobiae bacterium]|nr:sulfatase-like hydrolase/transferase [Verrucomicrobiae bacterium]
MTDPSHRLATPAINSRPWREWAWIYLGNCLVTVVLQLGYVLGLSTGLHGFACLAFALAVVSQAGFLNLVPALLTAWPLLCWRNRTWARLVAGFIFALLQITVLADIVIFRLFQRHFDSLVWNLLTTKGAGDSVRVDPASMMMAALILFFFIAASLAFALWGSPKLVRRRWQFGVAIILIALLGERSFFAVVDLRDNTTMRAVRDTLPFYQPLTFKRLAKRFGYKRPAGEIRILPDSAKSLHLPQHPLGLSAGARKPNILFIAIESGRADALDDKTMPNVSHLAGDSIRLTRHFSTGDETRFGLFGLLYGIPATYWHRALAQNVSPPWFDLLAGCGYQFKIMSCTDLNYPEFRQTAFVKLTNAITDQWEGPRSGRDRLMADQFLRFLADRASQPTAAPPYFGFLFFNASHQPYEHPAEYHLYPGCASGEISYLRLTVSPASAAALRGSYLNSINYIDEQIGRIVQALKDRDEYQNTIIVVVGDHGEEFAELGHFGHCSGLNRFQTQTLGVLHLPGASPRVVDNVTSHVDFVPTVLTWMRITNPPGDYTTGKPIGGQEPRKQALLAGWADTAVAKQDSITVFKPSRTLYLDMDGVELPKADPRRASSSEILQALQETTMFFK